MTSKGLATQEKIPRVTDIYKMSRWLLDQKKKKVEVSMVFQGEKMERKKQES